MFFLGFDRCNLPVSRLENVIGKSGHLFKNSSFTYESTAPLHSIRHIIRVDQGNIEGAVVVLTKEPTTTLTSRPSLMLLLTSIDSIKLPRVSMLPP